MSALTHDAAMTALREVQDPELHRSIVDLGMVGDVAVEAGRVRVAIRLTVAGCPLKAEIQRRVTHALSGLEGVDGVQVTMDAMSDEERRAMRAGLGGAGAGRPSPFLEGSATTVIGIASGKGGVGKSSITANLAVALARRGATVGLLDADVYGYSIPRMMGVTRPAVTVEDLMMPVESHGVRLMSIGFLTDEDSPVIWRGPMLHKALTSFVTEVWWDEPDYLLVDLPPGTGDVSISIAQLLPTASLVIVTTPQLAAQRVARRAAAMAARVNLRVAGVIENMSWFVAPDTGARYEVFSGGGGSALAHELGVPLLGQVPLEASVAQAGDEAHQQRRRDAEHWVEQRRAAENRHVARRRHHDRRRAGHRDQKDAEIAPVAQPVEVDAEDEIGDEIDGDESGQRGQDGVLDPEPAGALRRLAQPLDGVQRLFEGGSLVGALAHPAPPASAPILTKEEWAGAKLKGGQAAASLICRPSLASKASIEAWRSSKGWLYDKVHCTVMEGS
ncbi:MAG: P-loop NTPase [Dehalococcoidia bacterium]|nr:P-loop NTPase [Dehalococcoidia bacterium]